jgi:hypothetical protein
LMELLTESMSVGLRIPGSQIPPRIRKYKKYANST